MKYKYSKSSKKAISSELHLFGVYTDKNIKHITYVDKHVISSLKKSINVCSFTGKLGDHRTFDDANNKSQTIVFGLGEKDKINQRILTNAITMIIKI